VGVYDVDAFVVPENPTEFERILAEFKAGAEEGFGEGIQAKMIIEDWQHDLKRVTLELDWEDPAKKPEDTVAQSITYIHKNTSHD
jgi:hypothetical protein